MNKNHLNNKLMTFGRPEQDRKSLKNLEELTIRVDEYSLQSLNQYNLFFENEKIFMSSILEIYLDSIKKIGALRKNAKQIIGTAFFQGRDFLNEELGKCLEDLKHVKYFSRRGLNKSQNFTQDVRKGSLNIGKSKAKRKRRHSKHLDLVSEKKKASLYDDKMYQYLKKKDFPLYNYFVNKIGVFSINGKLNQIISKYKNEHLSRHSFPW